MTSFPPVQPEDERIIRSFPAYQGSGTKGFVTNFLGVKTRTAFHTGLVGSDGGVEGYPLPANCHATSLEWAGGLRAVVEAGEEFVAVELGAGWAPWLVSLAVAARRRGVRRSRLVGVEGSRSHFDFMRTHFLDNGLDPDQHQLLHAVVGREDGQALFPILADPAVFWGTAAIYLDSPAARTRAGWESWRRWLPWPRKSAGACAAGSAVERVTCHSLATVLRPWPAVDLLHVDIQGAEAEVLLSAGAVLRAKVKRIVVGTHGRDIEMELLDGLARRGWLLEADEACTYVQQGAAMTLVRDGCQVWANPDVGRSKA